MKDFEKFEELGITSKKEFEEVKKDYRECKKKVDKLEWFLGKFVEAFQSEYSYIH